jgi:hypothetical protein
MQVPPELDNETIAPYCLQLAAIENVAPTPYTPDNRAQIFPSPILAQAQLYSGDSLKLTDREYLTTLPSSVLKELSANVGVASGYCTARQVKATS